MRVKNLVHDSSAHHLNLSIHYVTISDTLTKMAAALPTRPSGAQFEEFTPKDAKEESRLTTQIFLAKATFKPKGPYDSEFFHKVAETTRNELERTQLNKKQSGYNFFKSRRGV